MLIPVLHVTTARTPFTVNSGYYKGLTFCINRKEREKGSFKL